MDDMEITLLCMQAMGYAQHPDYAPTEDGTHVINDHACTLYQPLKNSGQAMALEDWLIERGKLEMKRGWYSYTTGENHSVHVVINSAAYGAKNRRLFLCMCVAKVHQEQLV